MQRVWAFVFLIAAVACGSAQAGALSVMPTRVDFGQGRAVQSLLLTNQSSETVTLEVQVVVWPDEAPGQLANDIVVTPSVVTLPPNERTRVRVGMLRRAAGDAERAYRIYFTELPVPQPAQGGAIGVRLRVGVPVFIAPDEAKPEPLRWTAKSSAEGWMLEALNPGNVHTRLAQASLLATGGENQKLQLPMPYVLANSVLRVPLARKPAAGSRVRWMEGSDEREGVVAQP